MITSIQKLQYKCKECGCSADFRVVRTNDDLSEEYLRDGVRTETYCRKHLPQEAIKLWNFNAYDLPGQQL